MASFTDKIVEFNPYIQQIPVDDYVRVGMMKQQQYEQGVQKVQSYIDSIRGLEVAKDVHKEYLDKTLQNMQGAVSGVVSADFSNSQLVNQVGALTNRIASDPIIQNAVVSTQRYKQGLTEMQKARQEGKSSVENEWHYQAQAQSWLQDKDATSSFSGQYIPYRDVRKKIMETIKQIDSSSKLTQLPFRRNADGSTALDKNGNPEIDIAMLEVSEEGKSVETIRRAVELALDEGDIQQLGIEGQYHYRNYDPVAMKGVVDGNYKARIESYNDRLDQLATQKMQNINDSTYQTAIDNQIKAVRERAENIQKSYQRDIGLLSSSPEGFKQKFYTENYFDQVAGTFSTTKQTYKYLDNPYQKQVNSDRDFKLQYQKFLHDSKMDEANFNLKLQELDLKERELSLKAKESVGFEPSMLPLDAPTDIAAPTTASWEEGIKQQENTAESLKTGIISSVFPTLPRDKAEVELMKMKESWEKGQQIHPGVAEYFAATAKLNQDITNKKTGLMNINNELNKNPDLNLAGSTKGIGFTMGQTSFSGEEVINFNNKIDQILKPNTGGAPTIDKAKADQLLSTKEKDLFKIWSKNKEGGNLTGNERIVMGQIQKARNLSPQIVESVNKREQFIGERLAPLMNEYRPEHYNIAAAKPEQRDKIEGNVHAFLMNAQRRGESVGESPNFNFDDAMKATNNKDTRYGVYKQGDKTYITLSGTKDYKTQFIPVSGVQMQSLFGSTFYRPFDPIQRTIALSGGRTTNVQGKGAQTAYLLKTDFPHVGKYGVKGDIETVPTGGYVLKFYIHDPATNSWRERLAPRVYTDEDELLNSIKGVGDLTIEQLLAPPEQKK